MRQNRCVWTQKGKHGLDCLNSMMSPVIITMSFVCHLKQEEHHYPFAFSYVLRESHHLLKLKHHLDDVLVKACCWVATIHALVSGERCSCLTHTEWDPKPEENLCDGTKKKKNPKMVTSASFWTHSSLLVLTEVQHCNTVVSVIHSQQWKSNTNRCLVTGISLVWSTKALMHIWRLPMFPMNVSAH